MIQGGDFTNGDGTGGHAAKWYGYCNGVVEASSTACVKTSWTIPDEASNGLKHTAGALSMAKTANANTGGSQFFVVPSDSNPSHLDGKHTVFGYVTDGMEHIDSISEAPTHGENGNQIPPDKPLNDVTLVSVTTDSTQSTPWYRTYF
jgi:cyclophilin family peptidyl-prolyl cis-trans isomerase